MYLSKITFSRQYLAAMVRHFRKGLFHEHQMIWDLFAADKHAKRDFLYYREDDPKSPDTFPFYYLLSERKPASHRPELIIQTQSYAPQLKAGDCLHFSLRANATKMVDIASPSSNPVYKRKGIIEAKVHAYKTKFPEPKDRPAKARLHHEAGEEWLARQSEKAGFKLMNLMVENHQFHQMKKPKKANKPQGNRQCFSSIDFKGQLQVTQPECFLETCFYARDQHTQQLIAGFGRSKAFGCGLMLIRRV